VDGGLVAVYGRRVMRHGRGYGRRPDQLERRPAEAEHGPAPPQERVLALQRSAGNQAVSAMLARAPETAAPADAKGTEGPRATLSGIGTIPLQSVSVDPNTQKREDRPREIVVTSRLGKHSALLSKAAADGAQMDVEIVMPSGRGALRLTLTGAVVSAYQVSGELESWTLDFSSIELEHEGEPEGDDAVRPGWDLGREAG